MRLSFVGGGSDLPSFYLKHGGAVVSTSIDRYVYITANAKFDSAIRVSYSKTEEVERVDRLEHPIIRECLKLLNIRGGVEITSISDIPAKGTGLGSSSSFTVGLLNCLNCFNRQYVSAEYLAQESCRIEIEKCGEPIGKQDQYAAAYGGLNFIRFNQDGSVFVDPIICLPETIRGLENSVLVFYTGVTRSASKILKAQQDAVESDLGKQESLRKMVCLAYAFKDEIQNNRLENLGEILHENWLLKKSLTDSVTNPQIDAWYERGLKAGATGGKLLGAGAGGFLIFLSPAENHSKIISALNDLRPVKFRFTSQGSRIIFIH